MRTGKTPSWTIRSSGVADTDVGPWIADYQAGNMKPMFFRSPMHCATVSRDGFLYACDRGNNRVQVFDLGAADLGKPCANPNAEPGKCGFVREVHVAPQTASGTSGTAALSTDPEQSCLYVGDLANGTLYIINRENLTELDRIGRAGRQAGEFHWLHALAVDSHGDIYTGEVDTGQRVQKFLRYGASSCSGTGSCRSRPLQREQVGEVPMSHARMSWVFSLPVAAFVAYAAPCAAQNRLQRPEHETGQRPAESVLGEAADAAARRPQVGLHGRRRRRQGPRRRLGHRPLRQQQLRGLARRSAACTTTPTAS